MSTLNLHDLASRFMRHFLPVAAIRQNLLVNDIPQNLSLQSDRKLAISVLHTMISAIVRRSENNCIRLSAKVFDGMVLLTITDGKEYNDCAIIEGIQMTEDQQPATVFHMPVYTHTAGGFFNIPHTAA